MVYNWEFLVFIVYKKKRTYLTASFHRFCLLPKALQWELKAPLPPRPGKRSRHDPGPSQLSRSLFDASQPMRGYTFSFRVRFLDPSKRLAQAAATEAIKRALCAWGGNQRRGFTLDAVFGPSARLPPDPVASTSDIFISDIFRFKEEDCTSRVCKLSTLKNQNAIMKSR